MERLTREGAQRVLDAARAAQNEATDSLSQQTFLDQRSPEPWTAGPFEHRADLDFALRTQWEDPADIGWTSESIINPTLIARGDELHLFYRASPKKESLSSRIGHAVFTERSGWQDAPSNPAVFPTADNEVLGVEDPKIYEADGQYVLFYNGIFPVDADAREQYPSPGYLVETVGCDINVATSEDLSTWTLHGPITDHAITRLWAKGAVIPRDENGRAVRIGGRYLMYLSEGCDGVPHVGQSDDLVTWTFSPQSYLDLRELGGHLHEVATAFVHDGNLILDFFYSRDGVWSAGQARYDLAEPFRQRDITSGGTLAWGGLTSWDGRLTFAQGWDSPRGARELQFYATS